LLGAAFFDSKFKMQNYFLSRNLIEKNKTHFAGGALAHPPTLDLIRLIPFWIFLPPLISETNICFCFGREGVAIFCKMITNCRKRKQQNPPLWQGSSLAGGGPG
jgi:hypothetical protein